MPRHDGMHRRQQVFVCSMRNAIPSAESCRGTAQPPADAHLMLLLLQLLPLLLLQVEQPELEGAGVKPGAPWHPVGAWQRSTTCREPDIFMVLLSTEKPRYARHYMRRCLGWR